MHVRSEIRVMTSSSQFIWTLPNAISELERVTWITENAGFLKGSALSRDKRTGELAGEGGPLRVLVGQEKPRHPLSPLVHDGGVFRALIDSGIAKGREPSCG
jgi:hypothetical protein